MTKHSSQQSKKSSTKIEPQQESLLQMRPFSQDPEHSTTMNESQPGVIEKVKSGTFNISNINVFDGGAVPNQPPATSFFQPKLTIGEPNDKYEQEADNVAAQVVQKIHSPQLPEEGTKVQRSALPCNSHLPLSDPYPNPIPFQKISPLQRKSNIPTGPVNHEFESGLQQARSGGTPMAPQLRGQMESAMNTDFSRVKIHTDSQSDQLSRSIQAKAFTTGSDVFFKQGEYNPSSRGGQELIAHELTHVVQQCGEKVSKPSQVQREITDEQMETFRQKRVKERGDEIEQISTGIQDRQERGFNNERQESEAKESTTEESPETDFKSAPEFGSHFEDTSIGIENELSGLVCALPKNSVQKFALVTSSDNEPLVMITKDMCRGSYLNPANLEQVKEKDEWRTHTVELVTYPSLKKDKMATKSRNDAMLFLADHFKMRITEHNHTALEATTSKDGRFKLIVFYPDHVLASGSGTSLDGTNGQVGMSSSGQQATMGVKAKDFGNGTSPELKMLEAAPWYRPELKNEATLVSQDVEDLGTVQNVYAYLTSIFLFTAQLCQKWGIYLEDWDPTKHGIKPEALGLTDPRVKNDWSILPRTKPLKMLDLLSSPEKRIVTAAVTKTGSSTVTDQLLWKSIYSYFIGGGEVAGHGVNNATIGDIEDPDSAILFEFREMPKTLAEHAPITGVATVESLSLDKFKGAQRVAVVRAINSFVEKSGEEFDTWYQDYREQTNRLRVTRPPKEVASINDKAKWMQEKKLTDWQRITTLE